MSYDETVRYLYRLQKFGIKFGLENISRLMSALDNPHTSFSAVHVAGTNGKGSTSAIIASILQAAGLRVGLFTSPHLISFTERIRINGEEISEDGVIEYAEEIKDIVSRLDGFSPTFFEVVTAIAMLYFNREKVDAAVVEVGMGGRLDATNIISPEVSVITSIGFDHMDFLGNTLEEIAGEKTGIIKNNIPVVSAEQLPEAGRVIEKKAGEKKSALSVYGRDFSSVLKSEDTEGICFDYSDASLKIDDLMLPLAGRHQMRNASVAIRAAELFLRKLYRSASPSSAPRRGHEEEYPIREGLKNVRWPGRLEFVSYDPPVLIDGAHNPSAAASLAENLRDIFLKKFKKIIMVIGIMGDKDIRGIIEPLLPLSSYSILTASAYDRAASPERLSGTAASLGFSAVHIAPTVRDAIALAIKHSKEVNGPPRTGTEAGDSALIVITGSFYTIGEAKEALGQKGVLTRLRE
jgi:dihydrofolate synthase / folylpolyglutamate synthase